jgi:hypothetical protein
MDDQLASPSRAQLDQAGAVFLAIPCLVSGDLGLNVDRIASIVMHGVDYLFDAGSSDSRGSLRSLCLRRSL